MGIEPSALMTALTLATARDQPSQFVWAQPNRLMDNEPCTCFTTLKPTQ